MPLPLLIIAGAAVTGTTGVGLGIQGIVKMGKAYNKSKKTRRRNDANIKVLEEKKQKTCKAMDILGENELRILEKFKHFSDLFEKIHNRPYFENIIIGDVMIPTFSPSEIKDVSIGAGVLIGGITGSALGTVGGFAASGATTSAVIALGSASTGTAISSLSGVAATKATLAVLGGGTLATGGGGIALGTTVLGAATLGVGLLIGGAIFSVTGSNLSSKSNKEWEKMLQNEKQINDICLYFDELRKSAQEYNKILLKVRDLYTIHLSKMKKIINEKLYNGKVDWKLLSTEEKLIIDNMVKIVGVLYEMCKVQFVKKINDEKNIVNHSDIRKATTDAESLLYDIE